jgi:hypothetical protein
MGGDLPKDENLDWLLVCACHPTKAHQLRSEKKMDRKGEICMQRLAKGCGSRQGEVYLHA